MLRASFGILIALTAASSALATETGWVPNTPAQGGSAWNAYDPQGSAPQEDPHPTSDGHDNPCTQAMSRESAKNPRARSTVTIFHFAKDDDGQSVLHDACTGSIISEKLIVTAAHCVVDDSTNRPEAASGFYIHFGNFQSGQDPRVNSIPVRSLRSHPKFVRAEEIHNALVENYDLAVLQISSPLAPGYGPSPILPRACSPNVNARVVVAGCGPETQEYSAVCHAFTYKVARDQGPVTRVHLDQPSIAGGMKNGDSGGPAWSEVDGRRYLWGIASSSDERGGNGFYEDLRRHDTWLESAARDMGSYLHLP